MKRRNFFKNTVKGALGATLIPMTNLSCSSSSTASVLPNSEQEKPYGNTNPEQWHQMGTGKKRRPNRATTLTYDVAVIGGGAAGMCAAVAAARNGMQVVLIQDRPVLGGNSSSEIRVHLNGVNQLKDGLPERETGIIEEMLLHNRFHNPQDAYPVWDHVLFDFITRETNIDLKLNTSAMRAIMNGDTIEAAYCWQMTTETEFTIKAKQFIDCSGDGLLAATAGALYRTGREAASEFNEKFAPKEADGWQMGSTVLLGAKDMGRPMPFEPPHFTIKYDAEKSHKGRNLIPFELGFWWVEMGSDDDIIGEYEDIKETLMGHAYGVWDYLKNSGKFPETENYALDWVSSLPGKRESRRFIGDYILSEPDLLSNKQFPDAVAFGGWSLDEHNPGGIENLSEPPSYFHEDFEEPYQIPFRSLYSKNVSNLLFAGRNISQTHMALSSSRIMATCALEGQAVGTATALCVKHNVLPRTLGENYINDLQEQLLRDDAFIPNRPAVDNTDIAKQAQLIFASSTSSGAANLLTDGWSRDYNNTVHHWESEGLPAKVQMEWNENVKISKIEIKCDTNVKRNIMLRRDSLENDFYTTGIPKELLKALDVEVRVKGTWQKVGSLDKNRTRLIKFDFDPVQATAIRLNLKETYGAENVKLFELRCYAS
ncbi:FAD-dependent oxidoreductase [Tamlana agarivorans]|uniref:FAD-dependent oxidoreductase n=1 Tax=Pseudotamlana agarivorans TaxID=481183 RepID=A0ACC5U981_9FLAO|nr:FAD-dependent oxidoreductase [Tamlana agarivorans]MBU2950836.1 FAD-dependent oxidoreductase [Tamlana agarivorans]